MAKAKKRETDKNLYVRNGTYYARYQVNGDEVRVSLFTGDRAEAKRRLKPLLDVAALERSGAVTEHTYNEAVASWAQTGYGVRGDATRKRYKVSLRQMDPFFRGLKLHELTRRKIGEYVSERIANDAKHATVRRDLTAGSGLCRHAVAKGWMDNNPFREWDRSVIREFRDPIERVDMRSFNATVAEAPALWKLYLRFLLASGFRTEVDAASLERSKVNWQTGAVTFKTKRGRLRTRMLSVEALNILKEVPTSLTSPYVFARVHYGKIVNTARMFEDIRAKAVRRAEREGWTYKPFRLHDLRHEFAIEFLKHGGAGGGVGSIYTLQGLLGHTSVKTTEVYLDFLTDDEAEIAKGLRGAVTDLPSPGGRKAAEGGERA